MRIHPELLVICRLPATAPIPAWALKATPLHLSRTPGELSIVAPTALVPAGTQAQAPYQAIEVEGPLDFALTGILASLATPLAEAHISIFAISTFDTDYILIPAADVPEAQAVLTAAGHIFL